MPSYVSIDVNYVGDATGGTSYISVTAEQELTGGAVKVWSNINQDNIMGTSAWGGYNNQELMWIPIAWTLGTNGQTLNFTGPYPQTLSVMGSYNLTPSQHIFSNLNVSTWVQYSGGNKEVLNASFDDLPDTAAGVADESSAFVNDAVVVGAWPNPSTGAFSVASQLPQGVTGTVEIFNVSGRLVDSFSAGAIEPVEMEEPGVYYIRMTTSSGEIRNSQVAVVR